MAETFTDLRECREYSLLLRAQPPRVVHGVLMLASLLLGSAVTWAALTQADLVVRATGRVRSSESPTRVVYTARGEGAVTGLGGRITAVHARLGDAVRKGDVLVERDTERLANEIARRKRTLQGSEEELAKLVLLETLQKKQFDAALVKAGEELAHAETEQDQAKKRQIADQRLAQAEVEGALDEVTRTRPLVAQRAVAAESLVKAQVALSMAQAKLDRARLPAEENRVRIARQNREVLQREGDLKQEELAARVAQKRGETEAARLDLANLELERREAVLVAPVDGVVTWGEPRVGDPLEPGRLVLEIAESGVYQFEALVPSEEMGHVKVGMPARIRLDAYDHQRYGTLTGRVCQVSPDSTVPEGQSVACFKVKITADGDEVGRGDLRGKVKLGMAGQVEIVTEQQSLLWILMKKIRRTISLG